MSVNDIKIECSYCGVEKKTNPANIKKHEQFCYLNPSNKKDCPICGEPIKNYKTCTTCSYSCSNKYFRLGPNNGNWKDDAYQSTCFHYHKKECIICGESNIVTVHHLDENHNNNSPKNLIPLCPTHHQYCHSRYKPLVIRKIKAYIKNWSELQKSNLRPDGPKPPALPI